MRDKERYITVYRSTIPTMEYGTLFKDQGIVLCSGH